MSKLYIFGDSYSTPGFCVAPRDSFWGLLARDLGSKISSVENCSWPGNNIDSIGHVLVSTIDQFDPTDYLLIGIPPLQRLTMFNGADAPLVKKTLYNEDLTEQDTLDILCHRGLAQYSVHEMDKQFVMLWNTSWVESQVLRQLLTLDAFLINKIKKLNVVYFNLSVPFQPLSQWPTLHSLQQQAVSNTRMVLFDNTYYTVNLNKYKPVDYDKFGPMGHYGADGNKNYYESVVKPKVQELQWF